MVKCSALQFRKTGGAMDPQLPVGWMVNHREAQEGGREQGAEGEEEQEALEGLMPNPPVTIIALN